MMKSYIQYKSVIWKKISRTPTIVKKELSPKLACACILLEVKPHKSEYLRCGSIGVDWNRSLSVWSVVEDP